MISCDGTSILWCNKPIWKPNGKILASLLGDRICGTTDQNEQFVAYFDKQKNKLCIQLGNDGIGILEFDV